MSTTGFILFLHQDCANVSQLRGLMLVPKTDQIDMQKICPTECAWAAKTCGRRFE